MAKPNKKPSVQKTVVPIKPIRYESDFQIDWEKSIERLKQERFRFENREIHGDAPKDFLRAWEPTPGQKSIRDRPSKWPGYIAKVGSKWYPVESVIEHLITRIGQACNINITDSRLCIVGSQVRFLSRYFLDDSCERLTHGLDLFRRYLDEDTIKSIERTPRERQEYTFQFVENALNEWFPEQAQELKTDFVTMLGFDAFVGNMDRHPLNWGLIVPVSKKGRIRFSPIFDSARGLFWNDTEAKISSRLQNPLQLNSYIEKCQPQIGWDAWKGAGRFNHFTLIGLISSQRPEYIPTLRRFTQPELIGKCEQAIEREFSTLLSEQRRRLIVQCLRQRSERLASLLPDKS